MCQHKSGLKESMTRNARRANVRCPMAVGRRCSHFVRSRWSAILDYSIAGSDIMQEKVAERMNQLISESLWYDERAAVDHRPFRGSDNRADMACFTTDFRKNLCAAFGVRRVDQILVSRRNFRST